MILNRWHWLSVWPWRYLMSYFCVIYITDYAGLLSVQTSTCCKAINFSGFCAPCSIEQRLEGYYDWLLLTFNLCLCWLLSAHCPEGFIVSSTAIVLHALFHWSKISSRTFKIFSSYFYSLKQLNMSQEVTPRIKTALMFAILIQF